MKKKISLLLVLFTMVIMMIAAMPASAAQKNKGAKKALKAYSKYLTKSKIRIYKGAKVIKKNQITRFAVAYIDNDNIPELIFEVGKLKDSSLVPYHVVLSYRNKKVVMLTNVTRKSKFLSYFPYMNVMMSQYDENVYPTYNINGLGVEPEDPYVEGMTDAEYDAAVKKQLESIVGDTPQTEFDWKKNTKKNRKKFLK